MTTLGHSLVHSDVGIFQSYSPVVSLILEKVEFYWYRLYKHGFNIDWALMELMSYSISVGNKIK